MVHRINITSRHKVGARCQKACLDDPLQGGFQVPVPDKKMYTMYGVVK